jgi:molybdate/tungstate transport system substrate-binding protein
MECVKEGLTRRELLVRGGLLTLGAVIAGLPARSLSPELAVLDVAYAGSMGSMMEGPVKTAVAKSLELDMHGRAQGSSALAHLIAGGSIRPDVFMPVTPGPMLTVLRAGKAETAEPITHTEMVIAYSPKSRCRSAGSQHYLHHDDRCQSL